MIDNLIWGSGSKSLPAFRYGYGTRLIGLTTADSPDSGEVDCRRLCDPVAFWGRQVGDRGMLARHAAEPSWQ